MKWPGRKKRVRYAEHEQRLAEAERRTEHISRRADQAVEGLMARHRRNQWGETVQRIAGRHV